MVDIVVDNIDPLAALYNSQVKKAWKIFEKNGDGKLTPQEFRFKRIC